MILDFCDFKCFCRKFVEEWTKEKGALVGKDRGRCITKQQTCSSDSEWLLNIAWNKGMRGKRKWTKPTSFMKITSETLHFLDCLQLVCGMINIKLCCRDLNITCHIKKETVYEKYVFNLRQENKMKLWLNCANCLLQLRGSDSWKYQTDTSRSHTHKKAKRTFGSNFWKG